jgi:hypothetical protein
MPSSPSVAVKSVTQTFRVALVADPKGRVVVPVPFDPDSIWGKKGRHHVSGSVNGMGVRGVIEDFEEIRGLVLGPAWRRGCGLGPGDSVAVILEPEGPQRDGLAEDLAAALAAEPDAAEFFDSLAQFYRNAYLTWIDATKRRPEVRVERITMVVDLLKAKQKQRPST